MKPIAIYGAGGFGRETLVMLKQINRLRNEWDIIGFVDDSLPAGSRVNGLQVLGNMDWLNAVQHEINLVIAIGNPSIKKDLADAIVNPQVQYATLIHPSVDIEDYQHISIGRGSIITAGNLLTTDIKIGEHVLLNLACTIGHDASIGSYCSLMPGCHISGNVQLSEGVYIGTGSEIINGMYIEPFATVGAGAVVVDRIQTWTTVVGVPARPVKKKI